jgi:ABC-type Fe3+ transport system permease subunit
MLLQLLSTILGLVVAVQAVPGVPLFSNSSETEARTNIDTRSDHLSTEAIISIISVVVTIVIGIVTVVVTVIGIALAWWQWKTLRGRSRRSSSTTSGTYQC